MLVNSDKKWDYALGMIKVDGLEPTPEFKRLIEKEKRGEMTMDDIKQTLDKKYKIKEQGKMKDPYLYPNTEVL